MNIDFGSFPIWAKVIFGVVGWLVGLWLYSNTPGRKNNFKNKRK